MAAPLTTNPHYTYADLELWRKRVREIEREYRYERVNKNNMWLFYVQVISVWMKIIPK